MPLTDTTIRNSKAKEKQYKLSDEMGLYLLVGKTGRKYFRFDYRFMGKRKTLALGVYPDITLANARQKRDDARKLVQKGVDPSQHKRETKRMLEDLAVNNFEAVAREWFEKNTHVWTKKHSFTVIRRLEFNVFPLIGSRPIKLIIAPELLEVLRKIESRGPLYYYLLSAKLFPPDSGTKPRTHLLNYAFCCERRFWWPYTPSVTRFRGNFQPHLQYHQTDSSVA